MPLIVVNDLLFIWGSVGSLSINSCNVGMLEGEISWTGGGFFGGGLVVSAANQRRPMTKSSAWHFAFPRR